MTKMKWYDWLTYFLLILGGINLGLTGVFEFNLIEKLISLIIESYTVTFAYIKTAVYTIIGLAALYGIYTGIKLARR